MARILVVDDDPDIRFVARGALKRGKHEVTVADSVRAPRGALRVVDNVSSAFQRERILAAVTDALTRSLGAAAARVWLVGPGDSCGTCEMADRCHNRKSCLHLVEHGGLGPLDRVLR